MNRGLGVNVVKSDYSLTFPGLFHRNFPRSHLAEQTLFHTVILANTHLHMILTLIKNLASETGNFIDGYFLSK